ncbi:hypothetical protein ACFONN_17280 [Dyella humi]|uniref:Uncharacterized protein n=1 Tax=Dyella humi TaxID=1770547 RepID=A0ABW8IFE7_9GAMM
MFNQILLLIYRLFLHRGGRKINWMEQYLGYDGRAALSSDDIENESSAYETIFSEEHRPKLERLYLDLLNEMDGVPYPQCGDVLEALTFIQEISATALWKYHQSVGTVIEEFVRDFDRLDVPDERARLYEKAQNTGGKGTSSHC